MHRAGATVDGMASLSAVILSRRAEYYDTLAAVQGGEFQSVVNVAPFVCFHTSALLEAVTALQRYVARLNEQGAMLRSQRGDLRERQIVGLLAMLEFSPLSASTYADLTECSAQTARSDLATLVGADFVDRLGRGKATRYDLTDSTRALFGETPAGV